MLYLHNLYAPHAFRASYARTMPTFRKQESCQLSKNKKSFKINDLGAVPRLSRGRATRAPQHVPLGVKIFLDKHGKI